MPSILVINCSNSSDENCIRNWERRYTVGILVVITVIYCAIFLVGLLGNITTCLVIYRTRFMHTATNFYLVNLSVSDLLVLVLRMPFDIYSLWRTSGFPYSLFLCFGNSLSAETCTYSSVLTVVAFTVERYLAICHPMSCTNNNQHNRGSLRRALKVILVIWLMSVLFGSLMASLTGLILVHRKVHGGGSRSIPGAVMCTVIPERMKRFRYSFAISSIALFILPIAVITVLYVLIGMAVQRSIRSTRKSSSNSTNWDQENVDRTGVNQARARRTVIKMLVAIVIAFFICYAPFHANRMIGSLLPPSVFMKYRWLEDLDKAVFSISGVFFYASSIVNPILYNLMSLKFRKAFRNTIVTVCCRWFVRKTYTRTRKTVYTKPQNKPTYTLRYRRRRARSERPAAKNGILAVQHPQQTLTDPLPARIHHSEGNMIAQKCDASSVMSQQHSLPVGIPKVNGAKNHQEGASGSSTSCSKSGVAAILHLSDPFCAQRADLVSCVSATGSALTVQRVNLCPQTLLRGAGLNKQYMQRNAAKTGAGRRRYSDGLPSQGLFQVGMNDFHCNVEQLALPLPNEQQKRQRRYSPKTVHLDREDMFLPLNGHSG